MTQNYQQWVDKIISGEAKLHQLPQEWDEYERARMRMMAIARMVGNESLIERVEKNGVVQAASGKNAEQIIGELTVPLSVVGPLSMRFEKEAGNYWVPLSTTEGALVASVQRGVKAVSESGGVNVMVEDRGMTRAPVFEVGSIAKGEKIAHWIKQHASQLAKLAEATSHHLTLKSIEPSLIGRSLFVRFRFDTGEAMGMNMVTIATQACVEYIEEEVGVRCVALSGNACVDKKAAWSNVLLGRGLSVQADVFLPLEVVRRVLKTSPEAMAEVVMRKDMIGSAASGSMGFNGHFANVVAAVFLATGQDMAHVVEGSSGITTAEVVDKGLYMSVQLPTIIVGVVGGGTGLPVQRAALEIMGLSKGRKGEKQTLGALIGSVVLAGEISLTAALAAGHLARAHQRLGRKII